MSDPPPTTLSEGQLHLPRILCLHGGGVNAQIFLLQSRALRRSLGDRFRFVFPDAPFISPPQPDIVPFFGDLKPFRRWLRWQPDQPEARADVMTRDIDRVLDDAMAHDDAQGATGEWVALMGFSQGAKVCASLLLRQQLDLDRAKGPADAQSQAQSRIRSARFRFAVVMAGRAPLVNLDPSLTDSIALANVNELTTGIGAVASGAFLDGSDESEHIIRLPTLHVHGTKDPGLKLHRSLLHDYCRPGSARLVEWAGDHRVVIHPDDVKAVVDQILALSKQTGLIKGSA